MLMLDSPAAKPKDREEMASILFENFAIPAFYSMMGVSDVHEPYALRVWLNHHLVVRLWRR